MNVERDSLSKLDIISPQRYGAGYPHAEWQRLRRQAPILKMNIDGYPPFWALTRHGDVEAILKQPQRFLSGPRSLVLPLGAPPQALTRAIVNMDPPEHLQYRRLAMAYFNPKSVAQLEERIRISSRAIIEEGFERGSINVSDSLAVRIPLNAIMTILGCPRQDEDLLLSNTNKLLAGSDASYQGEGSDTSQTNMEGYLGFADYFKPLADRWRVEGGDHLAATLAQSQINGEPISDEELISYYIAIIIAGFDTTRLSISGGLHAFIEHPDQWHRLAADPDLLGSAIDEIFRWSSPVVHFARTVAEDIDYKGHAFKAGDIVAVFHPSANRDEAVFAEPHRFDVGRQNNRHVAFGYGPHLCIGKHLAVLEMKILLQILLAELDFEQFCLETPVEHLSTNLVGGLKTLQVRFRKRVQVGAGPAGEPSRA